MAGKKKEIKKESKRKKKVEREIKKEKRRKKGKKKERKRKKDQLCTDSRLSATPFGTTQTH